MPNIGCLISSDPNRRAEIESLLSFVCQKDRSWLYGHNEYELSESESLNLESCLKRLNSGEPVAYIVGYKDFYNLRFSVNPSVLIPRPESEMIVDEALSFAKNNENASFFDIGTGSGALIISIAKNIHNGDKRFFAGDISSDALKVARENAKLAEVDIIFKEGSLLQPFQKEIEASGRVFIAANLPYLTPQERVAEPSISKEPDLALIGGSDGLDLYRELLEQASHSLKSKRFQMVMEISPWQEDILLELCVSAFPSAKIQKMPDLSGRTRFISIRQD